MSVADQAVLGVTLYREDKELYCWKGNQGPSHKCSSAYLYNLLPWANQLSVDGINVARS